MPGPTRGASMGVQYGFLGFYGDDDKLTGGTLDAPANGNQNGNPFDHILGIQSASPATPDPDTVQVNGDDDLIAEWELPSNATRRFNIDVAAFDMDQIAAIQDTNVVSFGDGKLGAEDIANLPEVNACLVLQGRTKKQDVGVKGRKAWSGVILPTAGIQWLGRVAFNSREGAAYRFSVTPQLADLLPWGVTISDLFGTSGLRRVPFSFDNPIHIQVWRGDGAEDEFVTQHTPISVAKTKVIVQRPGFGAVEASVSGVTPGTKTIALASPPADGATVVGIYEFSSFVDR